MSVTCVFGMQWGDEGKGRIVDLLARASRRRGAVPGGRQRRAHRGRGDREVRPPHAPERGDPPPDGERGRATGWSWTRGCSSRRSRTSPAAAIDVTGRLPPSRTGPTWCCPTTGSWTGRWSSCGAGRRWGPPAGGSARPTATRRCAKGSASPTSSVPGERTPASCATVAARNEILRRAGLEPLDPRRRWSPTCAQALDRLRPYVADTVALLLAGLAGRASAILLRGRPGLRPGRGPRLVPVRHVVHHRAVGGLRRDRPPAEGHRAGAGRDEGLHHPGRRGPLPHRGPGRGREAPGGAGARVRGDHRAAPRLRLVRRRPRPAGGRSQGVDASRS